MQIKRVGIDQLMPDPDVQFEWAFDQRRAKKMALNYDPMLAGVIDAVPLNGENSGMLGAFVGRHRLFAAREAGEKSILCAIWPADLPASEKHRIKLGKDRDRRNVRAVETFLNEVGAREIVACDILNLCLESGYTINKNSSGKPYTQIEAVQTLRAIYGYGRDHLRRVLTLNTLWMDEPRTNTSMWLGGLHEAVLGGWTDKISPSGYNRMKELIPAKIMRDAIAHATARGPALLGGAGTAPHIAERLRKASGVKKTI